MSDELEITGALYFSKHDPVITGRLWIGDQVFEICGVRRSKIRTDFKAQQHKQPMQRELFDGFLGDGKK